MSAADLKLTVEKALAVHGTLEKVASTVKDLEIAESARYNHTKLSFSLSDSLKTASDGTPWGVVDALLQVRALRRDEGVKMASDVTEVQDACVKLATAVALDGTLAKVMETATGDLYKQANDVRALGCEYMTHLTKLITG